MKLPLTEQSLWRDAYPGPLYPELKGELRVDVAIVGAGITGLTSAYLLKRAGFTVAVLDKDSVGGGTTGRTTGKVTAQHGLIYSYLHKKLGAKDAALYGEANQNAVKKVIQIISQEKIECDLAQSDNYVFTADVKQVKNFKQEAEAAASLGLPASFTSVTSLPFEIAGAVKFSDQASISSQKYLNGLAKAIDGNGSYVFENSNVTGIRDGKLCRVKTKDGTVYAKDVVVATNVPTLPLMARGGYCMLEYPTESYIVAGLLDKNLPGMYISPDNDHYSILPVNFNDRRYLLIGGGGHVSGMRLGRASHFERLAAYAKQHFGITTFTNNWSDRDYVAYDKVPLIGKLYPWSKHVYVGTAFKKWGLSGGTAAAMILTDLIAGKKNKYAHVFTPQRLRPIASIPRAVWEQAKQQFSS